MAGAYKGGNHQGKRWIPANNLDVFSSSQLESADIRSRQGNKERGRRNQQKENQPPKGAGPRFKGESLCV